MTLTFFIIILGFLTVIQAMIPHMLRQTLIFGVTVPESFTRTKEILTYKRLYTFITFFVGFVFLALFTIWAILNSPSDETIVLVGTVLEFALIALSLGMYFTLHAKMLKLKSESNWEEGLKKVRVADVTFHKQVELVPRSAYIILLIVTAGLVGYTFTQYGNLPDVIPIHWGPNGQPDGFTNKSPFSVIGLLIILLIMQGMMLAINEMMRRSGVQLSANRRKVSRTQQLAHRKYSSLYLYLITFLMTALFGFLQLGTIHENIASQVLLISVPLIFLFLVLIGTAVYAFKVGQSGSRIRVEEEDEQADTATTDADDDRYWKGGIFYINKQDPSILVEKRFGIGWTLNFGHPLSAFLFIIPIVLILVVSFLI
ncbi:DUF1648 domain-containing protein [bacterium LRH843]|nr:DUF1648 domain-containing protein [bacterium LRH843]